MRTKPNKPILYISPLPPPNGGIATWTQKIVKYGLPHGQRVTLINTKIRGKRNIFDKAKISFAECWRTISIFALLCYHVIYKRPRLVHINCALSPIGVARDLCCGMIVKTLGLPLVVHYHGNVPDFQHQRFYGASGAAFSMLMRLANVNLVTNKVSLDHIPYKNKLAVIPNFIEDQLFTINARKTLTPPHYRALFVGGITRAKGCRELIFAANAFPHIEFHLYGKMHNDMAREPLAANIHLHGEVPHDALIKVVQKYDFLVFPSYTEGFPLTVLEAMALGLPVIATHVGAIPQMIDDVRGGILIAPRNARALCKAIATLTSQPQLINQMGEYNRKKSFQSYRYSKVIKDLMHIYNRIQ